MEGIDIYPLEKQLEKNTPELPKLNVFQIILQLDLVFEGALYLELVTSTIEVMVCSSARSGACNFY